MPCRATLRAMLMPLFRALPLPLLRCFFIAAYVAAVFADAMMFITLCHAMMLIALLLPMLPPRHAITPLRHIVIFRYVADYAAIRFFTPTLPTRYYDV